MRRHLQSSALNLVGELTKIRKHVRLLQPVDGNARQIPSPQRPEVCR
jgi:hypothetical protein